MILSALCDLHARLSKDPESGMPPYNYSMEQIYFAVVLKKNGGYDYLDLREKNQKEKLIPRRMMVPAAAGRTNDIVPNFLWDNTGYMLGIDKKENTKVNDKFASFIQLHEKWASRVNSPELDAICAFLSKWKPDNFLNCEYYKEFIGQNAIFWLEGANKPVQWITGVSDHPREDSGCYEANCLATGKRGIIARTHANIKGLYGGDPTGSKIVSFNKSAFDSYGKTDLQAYNAPISLRAAHAYTAALNYLLFQGHGRCVNLGSISTVFWAEKKSLAESLLYNFLFPDTSRNENKQGTNIDESLGKDDQKNTKRVHSLLKSLKRGVPVNDALEDVERGIRFYILGLVPNKARVALTYCYVSTLGELMVNASRYAHEVALDPSPEWAEKFLTVHDVVSAIAPPKQKSKVVKKKCKPNDDLIKHDPDCSAVKNLYRDFISAVLFGYPYPQVLYNVAIKSIHKKKVASYEVLSIIKAYLIRNYHQEAPIMLDVNRQDVPYKLGRLFAVLEKTQHDSSEKKAGRTIFEKFWSAASTNPNTAFPQLVRLVTHHLATDKFALHKKGLMSEILSNVNEFPRNLTLDEQGIFILGYWHQYRDFFKTKEEKKEE